MKCLPQSKISLANGNVLHDWHAEVLALRGFNRFLIDECALLGKSGARAGTYVRCRERGESRDSEWPPFTVQDDVQIHMYCSEAPCGDASMELTMAAQEDPTPWKLEEKATLSEGDDSEEPILRGRGYFSELGIVRRKPGKDWQLPPFFSHSVPPSLSLPPSLHHTLSYPTHSLTHTPSLS